MQALQIASRPAQRQLSLIPTAAPATGLCDDPVGFQLGADHARHGVALPVGHLHEGSPLFAGWQSRARGRTQDPAPGIRNWLSLRLQAWEQGLGYEDQLLTPHYLRQLDASHCPVTREPLHDEHGHAQQRCVVRLRQDAGFAAGHLAVLGRTAAQALNGRGLANLMALARQAQQQREPLEGLRAADWGRLLALVSYVTPMPHAEASTRLQAALPTNRLRLLNPVQALQAWLSRQLASSGWSQRLRALHDALPGEAARTAATRLAVALAPHALQVPGTPLEQRATLEDLWADPRVQRRWFALVEQLSPLTMERLLRQLPPPPGFALERHTGTGAIAGW